MIAQTALLQSGSETAITEVVADKDDQDNRLLAHRRRVRGERTFAHGCETGGGRRTWLRGLGHVLKCAAYHLGLLLRKVLSLGKPRSSGALGAALVCLGRALPRWRRLAELIRPCGPTVSAFTPKISTRNYWCLKKCRSLTGCSAFAKSPQAEIGFATVPLPGFPPARKK